MKRILTIILAFGLIINFGCAKSNNVPYISKQSNDAINFKPLKQVDLYTNKTDAANNTNTTETGAVDNLFFFKHNVSQLNYKGKFLFDNIVEKDVKLIINEVANLKYGKLYELKINSIENVPYERLSLGYFHVKKDIIYKIEPTEENLNKLITSEELPNGRVIVCQGKEVKDTLGKDEPGWHHYIEVNGDKREYHSYNNQVSTGYYESFIWEKNQGLINYQSGYGAERDSIELQLSND